MGRGEGVGNYPDVDVSAPLLQQYQKTPQGVAAVPVAQAVDGPGGALTGFTVYNSNQRKHRDVGWSIGYSLLALTVVSMIVVAVKGVNPDYDTLSSSESLALQSTCPLQSEHNFRLGAPPSPDDAKKIDVSHFLEESKMWLGVAVGGSLALGISFLAMLAACPRFVVKFSMFAQALCLAAMGVSLAPQGGFVLIGAAFCFLGAAALLYLIFAWPKQLETCSRLLGVAGDGIKENPLLGLVAICVKLCLLAVLAVHVVGIVTAVRNGQPAASNEVATRTASLCLDQYGVSVNCCVWQVDSWVVPFWALAGVSMLWSTFIAYDIKVFVVAGSIAQWYYLPVGSSAKGTTLRSLGHALGASFGSIAFGAFVLTIIEIFRQMMQQMRRSARNSNNGAAQIAACLCQCFFECFASIVEFLSKFALIEAAITGLSFWESGKSVTGLLKRHFGTAYTMWWLPPMVLHTFSFILSAVFGVAVALFGGRVFAHDSSDVRMTERVLLGVIAGVAALIVLGFFSTLVLNAVDAVFACYAHDLDAQRISKPSVHAVYAAVVVPVAVVASQAQV